MNAEMDNPWRSFGEIFAKTLSKVEQVGDPGDMSTWIEVYPDIEFEEVDETFTGKPVEWNSRTMVERAFYVNYMEDPQSVEVDYELEVDGHWVRQKIHDSEMLWYMWLCGCFKSITETVSDPKAKMAFFAYTNTGPYQSILEEMIGPENIKVKSWMAKMKTNNL